MKPPPFDYQVPTTVEEACALKGEYGADAAVLAGGQSLIPLMSSRLRTPQVLIDIKRIPELQEARRQNGSLVLAAAVRQWRLHDDAEIAGALPILAEASRHIGFPETRHRGTVGGSLAHADPTAQLPTVAVGVGAEVRVRSAQGDRSVATKDFFTGARQTALQPAEILVETSFPVPQPGAGWAYAEVSRRHGDPAMAIAVAMLALDPEGRVADVRLTVGSVDGHPRRAEAVESALQGAEPTPELITEASRAAGDLADPDPDTRGTGPTPHQPRMPASYRRRLAVAVSAQALTRALARVNGGDAK